MKSGTFVLWSISYAVLVLTTIRCTLYPDGMSHRAVGLALWSAKTGRGHDGFGV